MTTRSRRQTRGLRFTPGGIDPAAHNAFVRLLKEPGLTGTFARVLAERLPMRRAVKFHTLVHHYPTSYEALRAREADMAARAAAIAQVTSDAMSDALTAFRPRWMLAAPAAHPLADDDYNRSWNLSTSYDDIYERLQENMRPLSPHTCTDECPTTPTLEPPALAADTEVP